MPTPKPAALSTLKDEIQKLLKAGKKPAEFARRLMASHGVSKVTVYRHLKRLGWRRPKAKKQSSSLGQKGISRSGIARRAGRGTGSALEQVAERFSVKEIEKLKRIKHLRSLLKVAFEAQDAAERILATATLNHTRTLKKTRSLQNKLTEVMRR